MEEKIKTIDGMLSKTYKYSKESIEKTDVEKIEVKSLKIVDLEFRELPSQPISKIIDPSKYLR